MIPKDLKPNTGYIELTPDNEHLRFYAYCGVHQKRTSKFKSVQQPDFDGKVHWVFRCGDQKDGHMFPASQPKDAPTTVEGYREWVVRLRIARMRELVKPTQ